MIYDLHISNFYGFVDVKYLNIQWKIQYGSRVRIWGIEPFVRDQTKNKNFDTKKLEFFLVL